MAFKQKQAAFGQGFQGLRLIGSIQESLHRRQNIIIPILGSPKRVPLIWGIPHIRALN